MTQARSNQDSRSRLVQVFRYLQALNHLRNPVQREIEEQTWAMWLHDLPNHPFIQRGNIQATSNGDEEEETGQDEFILKVRRPRLTEAPEPPEEIVLWLQNGWQQADGKVIVQDSIETTNSNQPRVIRFRDDAARIRLLQDWQTRRDAWAKPEQIVRATFAAFEKLYALQSQLEREGERLELMLGDGLLTWRPKNGALIHHPVLLMHLQLHFNPQIPEFTLTDTGQPAEFYTALLQTIPEASASDIARSRKDFEQVGYHPLGGEDTRGFLIRFANQLSSSGQFIEQGQSISQAPALAPRISRDPVIFLRPRTLGISTALEAILEILPTSSALPFALTSLTGIEGISNTASDISTSTQAITSPNGEDEQILLSKPANAEQLEIAKILERKGAVLVQGPPGTGKTHTIANLIGHLLSQGKSVLVTSE
ncbi:MAG TPA: AAA domain-containing protein, partial [Ktedonobacteraceae bacterium]|nr:AAA domain-containing protein [Ktedonobacteraceae bacterium]